MITDPDDTTLASYEAAADSYIEQTTAQAPVLLTFLDRLADLVGHGHVLELGIWHVTFLAHVPGRTDQWLQVIAQPH
jgi:hypothetical protein